MIAPRGADSNRKFRARQEKSMQPRVKVKHRLKDDSAPGKTTSKSHRWVLVAVVLLSGGGAWAFAEFVLWNKLPSELVGKWVVEGGEQDGATFDFTRSGNMVGRINVKGNEHFILAKVDVEEKRLLATTENPNTGARETRTQTIVRLTRTQLILRDERGNDLRMVRADD